ncbi:alpha/beta hydrolase [Nocardia donostiensis]|uniref:Esterase n=1 Tax=Nocardia donostiensis TaxID=1538463 RepID=A0A1W0AQZ9_9NOCA|nr:alpha/beta hydrolase [Nocardia donostiensis]ONM49803.1 esterase [Nocardia donostiensis]OQS12667.1 esterase [Nocardia donostiensis]OQS22241.1 esterase [Nocardia donostiensis]
MNYDAPAWWDLLDDQAAAVARMTKQILRKPLHELGPEQARTLVNSSPSTEPITPLDHVEQLTVPTRAGAIEARLYRANGATAGTAAPALVYLHGGGFVLGTLDGSDELCRAIAAGSGWTVVSFEYRLAPENPYPAALEDCGDAYAWLTRSAPELGIAPDRIAVGGDSAGGNLAAALCLHLREAGSTLPVAQVLAYPAVDDTFTRPSWSDFADAPLLGAADARWLWEQYVGAGHPGGDYLAAPMRAESLRDLPPALIITAEVDPIRDDAEAYAQRLRSDGVQVSSTRYTGVFHGFFTEVAVFAQAKQAIDEVCQYLRELART